MSSSCCRFCEILTGKRNYGGADTIMMETSQYFAIPSIGGFIKGWTLIIPKKHVLSLKDCFSDSDFSSFVDEVIKKMSFKYEHFIFFEHGANVEGSQIACGTNHAHLHVLPFSSSLLPQMKATKQKWEFITPNDLKSFVAEDEYLLYGEIKKGNSFSSCSFFVHRVFTPESQYFRRLLAAYTLHPDDYDYKKQLQLENADYTRKLFASCY